MIDAVFMIAVTQAKSAAEKETTLEARLRAAMNATKDHWLLVDEDARFRAALGAVLLLSDTEDKDRIEKEVRELRTLSAMVSGVPIDFNEVKAIENPMGLVKLWQELKEQKP